MTEKFTTTDGRILMNDTFIKRVRLNQNWVSRKFMELFFAVWMITYLTRQIDKATLSNQIADWFGVGFIGLCLCLWFAMQFYYIIAYSWKKRIKIENIATISFTKSVDELETIVRLKLKSKRIKTYNFRTLENEFIRFTEALQKQNPAIQLVTQ